jgi:ferric iron reductase protein FhuF
LRLGWAAGAQIGIYLVCQRVLICDDYALNFNEKGFFRGFHPGGFEFAVLGVDLVLGAAAATRCVDRAELDQIFLAALRRMAEPVVEALFDWSRLSRHSLWSMVVSSWGAQFGDISVRMGHDPARIEAVSALFRSDAQIGAAAPLLYDVAANGNLKVCQRRAACCLYFKRSPKNYCASCPITPEAERLERNRKWVAEMQ